MRNATVVITGAGTVTCQSVIKAFRSQTEHAVKIVTVDASADVAGRYFSDRFDLVPFASAPEYVDTLKEICRRHEADLLIPIVDYEFMPISRRREEFRRFGCLAAVANSSVIAAVNNKLESAHFFRTHDFDTPNTWLADSALAAADELPYPVFAKPAIDGRSSIDCTTIATADDLRSYLKAVPTGMVQELITAPEVTADVLADWSSDVVGVVVRERLETKGGVSYKGRTLSDPVMETAVARMVKALRLQGPCNIQAFRKADKAIFIEINPRFSGAFALSLAAGFNSPHLLLKLALGEHVEMDQRFEPDVTMLRYWNEVFVHADGTPHYPEYRLEPAESSGQLINVA